MELANYTEYLVAKKADAKTVLVRILIIALWCVVVLASVFGVLVSAKARIFFELFLILWLLVGLLCWYLLEKTRIEYEYTIVSGYFQLDAIYAKKTRRRLCEAKIGDVQSLLRAKDAKDSPEFKKIIGCSSTDAEDAYRFVYKDAALGQCAVYFNASPKAIECFRYYNPKIVTRDMMK